MTTSNRRPTNDVGLPWLSPELMNTIFDCVYGVGDEVLAERTLLAEPRIRALVDTLLVMQDYNLFWREGATFPLSPLLEDAVGPMQRNSEGTSRWLALALALKDLYGLRRSTLGQLMGTVSVRK